MALVAAFEKNSAEEASCDPASLALCSLAELDSDSGVRALIENPRYLGLDDSGSFDLA